LRFILPKSGGTAAKVAEIERESASPAGRRNIVALNPAHAAL
jgi:hypothetical protein